MRMSHTMQPAYCWNGQAGSSWDRVFWKSSVRSSSTTQKLQDWDVLIWMNPVNLLSILWLWQRFSLSSKNDRVCGAISRPPHHHKLPLLSLPIHISSKLSLLMVHPSQSPRGKTAVALEAMTGHNFWTELQSQWKHHWIRETVAHLLS